MTEQESNYAVNWTESPGSPGVALRHGQSDFGPYDFFRS